MEYTSQAAAGGPQIVTAGYAPIDEERRVLQRMTRRLPWWVWLIIAPTLMYILSVPGQLLLTFVPHRTDAGGVYAVGFFVALMWQIVCVWMRRRAIKPPQFKNGVQRVEVHEEGVVCRSETCRLVIPFAEATALYRLPGRIVLFCGDRCVVWYASMLTAKQAAFIWHFISVRMPQETVFERDHGYSIGMLREPLEIPPYPPAKEKTAEAQGVLFPEGTFARRFLRLLELFGGWCLLMCGLSAALLGGLFRWSVPLLNDPWAWFGLLACVVFPAVLALTVWLDCRVEKQNSVRITVYTDNEGICVSDGRNEQFYPWSVVHVRRVSKGMRTVLPGGEVLLTQELRHRQTEETPENPTENDNNL